MGAKAVVAASAQLSPIPLRCHGRPEMGAMVLVALMGELAEAEQEACPTACTALKVVQQSTRIRSSFRVVLLQAAKARATLETTDCQKTALAATNGLI